MRRRNDILGEYLVEAGNFVADQVSKKVEKEVEEFKNRYNARSNLDILEYNADFSRRQSFYTPNEEEENRIVELIKNDDPDFDKELFEKFAEGIYRKFVEAHCNNNIDSLRKYIDINIIEFYKLKEYQNQMLRHSQQIEILNVNFVDFFGYHKESNLNIVSVAMGVVCRNFTKNHNNEIINGDERAKQTQIVVLSFARKAGAKTIKSINELKEGKFICPNCGSEIINLTNVCEYCGTNLYNSTDNWIVNHMELL